MLSVISVVSLFRLLVRLKPDTTYLVALVSSVVVSGFSRTVEAAL